MKILVLSNLYPPDAMGGYELGCRQAVEALRARGHEVRVLTSAPRQPVPAEPHVRRRLRLADIWSHYAFAKGAPVTAHLTQAQSHRVDAANCHALLEEVEEFRPDVAYVWMIVGVGGLGLMACLNHLRVPWVWHLMDDVPLLLCTSAGRVVPAFAREVSRQLRGRYLACSRQLVDEIEAGGVALGERVEVLPNWVTGPGEPRRSGYLQGGVLRIVSAAGLIDRKVEKGIDLLIEAAARLRDGGRGGFAIDVFGRVIDPWYPAQVRRLGVDDVVALRGPLPQDELGRRFADYDVFAFPTRAREPFGFAPLEAAARGCVPIVSPICGLSEWLVHGVHVLKAPRSAAGLAGALAAILDGKVDLGPIGRRVAAVVDRDFHLDALIGRIERALADAADEPRSGAGTAAEAYRLALLAEKLSRVLIQESLCA